MKDPTGDVRSRMASSRGVVVAALLGMGTVVMGRELIREHPVELAGAVALGVVLVFLLPAPRDVRSLVYAVFVPVAMTYGAVLGQTAMLLLGGAAGVFFILEKTSGMKSGKGDSNGSGGGDQGSTGS